MPLSGQGMAFYAAVRLRDGLIGSRNEASRISNIRAFLWGFSAQYATEQHENSDSFTSTFKPTSKFSPPALRGAANASLSALAWACVTPIEDATPLSALKASRERGRRSLPVDLLSPPRNPTSYPTGAPHLIHFHLPPSRIGGFVYAFASPGPRAHSLLLKQIVRDITVYLHDLFFSFVSAAAAMDPEAAALVNGVGDGASTDESPSRIHSFYSYNRGGFFPPSPHQAPSLSTPIIAFDHLVQVEVGLRGGYSASVGPRSSPRRVRDVFHVRGGNSWGSTSSSTWFRRVERDSGRRQLRMVASGRKPQSCAGHCWNGWKTRQSSASTEAMAAGFGNERSSSSVNLTPSVNRPTPCKPVPPAYNAAPMLAAPSGVVPFPPLAPYLVNGLLAPA
ncbi:hypothetical protein R3P38DRAFT_3346001 [Favolaschia claudopus]|uniref:Uncharacterized protein n=1 Tax=Favolaschia claudopus TaxID=2862362 RepID=A0AAW0DGK6_9AGAR